MTLEGAIKFHETDSYVIYTMNSATTGQYCVVLPSNVTGVMNMLVDLHMKGSFDGVSTGVKTKEQLVQEIGKEYENVKGRYVNALLVLPMADEGMFQNAVRNNDKQKMFDEVKKIGAITSEIYKKLTDSGVSKQNIDQKIIIVEKNEDDVQFVVWLKGQMPNFVDGVRYEELVPKEVVMNPFMPNAAVTNSESVATNSAPVVGNSIFDNVVPNVPVTAPATPVAPEPVIPTPSVENSTVDIFGIPNSVNGVAPAAESTVSVSAPEATASNVTASPFDSISTAAPVQQNTVASPSVDVPQPVNSVGLEGTTTFSPIPNVAPTENDVSVQTEEAVEENKNGSKGFVNLIILVVILVGVTIASIELGKFLYSVYGA